MYRMQGGKKGIVQQVVVRTTMHRVSKPRRGARARTAIWANTGNHVLKSEGKGTK